ncbi:hypothetical protein BJ508DRAFT_413168 [Ascobolus immersus RN42]|uniref:Uncharacterized protein n=1 Tax=Ascobolus immersus RN42 TaxID=1160509 RepID=A0A3N4ICJ8_ASCIM|nr:hypothetical protein BJ508DRAFT_413168 [Ascobolus immersus RN42]
MAIGMPKWMYACFIIPPIVVVALYSAVYYKYWYLPARDKRRRRRLGAPAARRESEISSVMSSVYAVDGNGRSNEGVVHEVVLVNPKDVGRNGVPFSAADV